MNQEFKKCELNKEILKFCSEKGFLLDEDVLNLFNDIKNIESVKLILDYIKNCTKSKIITKNVFEFNKENIKKFFLSLSKEHQKSLEALKINLNENSENFSDSFRNNNFLENKECSDVRIFSNIPDTSKSLEVKDFVNYFREKFYCIRDVLKGRSSLKNLVSINKVVGFKQNVSVIGIILDKRVTKNNNIIFEIEDLTGRMKVLVSRSKDDLFKRAEDISLDSVIGFIGSGGNDMFFANDIIFPEAVLSERKKSDCQEYALFLGDIHFGSKLFFKDNFLKFISYINGEIPNTPEVEKIKYLFIVGDLVTGVGNYPNQEKDLDIIDLEEQFIELAKLLGKIRKDVRIIISPGNHDGVRLMEPQPLFDEKYAWPLYELSNVFFTRNPSLVNFGANKNFSGFNVLIYHGFSFPFYAENIPSLIKQKAKCKPEIIMSYLLKNRHLAPTHGSMQYFPFEKDAHFIKDIPDIFVCGHLHKSGIFYCNNVLLISVSCWEAMTPYMEKMGTVADFCKVPMFDLKTRAVKILDFE
jgi:DNA polymerase II small subunit